MKKHCWVCDRPFKSNDLVNVVVVARWVEVPSRVTYSISKPVDAYPDTLKHHDCDEAE